MSTPAAYCYRLYVGEATPDRVLASLDAHGFNATVYPQASGLWEGTIEPSVVAEIICDSSRDDLIHHLAHNLACKFNQDCVLVTRSDLSYKALVPQS